MKEPYFPEFDDVSLWWQHRLSCCEARILYTKSSFYRVIEQVVWSHKTSACARNLEHCVTFLRNKASWMAQTILLWHIQAPVIAAAPIHTIQWIFCVMQYLRPDCSCWMYAHVVSPALARATRATPSSGVPCLEWLSTGGNFKEGLWKSRCYIDI